MTQSEERYAHLLQPIRDLAANWSVNIANDLEDYLEVLEGVQFSFAEGGRSLNFAEAALLIQGSACIYSKKVEYLHTLVYQALEFIADRRKRDTHALKALGEGGTAADVDSEFEDEEQFLSLDDVLEEGTGIDLDEGAAVALPAALRPPATLLALEDTGNSHGDGDAGNYRITACTVHRSGALLLEQRDGAHLDEHLQPMSSEVGCGQGGAAAPYWAPSAAAAAAGPGPHQAQQDWAASGAAADLGGGGFDLADDDYDMGGGGGFDDDDYYGPMDPRGEGGSAAAQLAGTAGEYQHAGAGPQPQPGEEPGGEEEGFDPYKPLDPNSRGTLKPKPFKKAARVPRKLLARRQHQQQDQQHLLAHDIDTLLTLQPPVTGLLFPEFSYALKQQESDAKPSQQGGRGGSRASSQRSAQTVAAPAFTYEEAVAGFAEDGEGADGAEFFDNGGFDHDDDDYVPLGNFDMPEGAVPLAAGGLEATLGGRLGGAGDFVDAAGVDELSYEELCRAHIEAFISAAAAAEVQSELASRVLGWRSKMAPVLEEEDARAEFDIHAYGERILQRLEQLSCAEELSAGELCRGQLPSMTFGQVVGVGPKFEASRSFSSMLQLVNNGNVRITKLGAGGAEGFTLTLLDRVLPHKKVTDYRALGGAAVQQKVAAAEDPAIEQPGSEEVKNQGPSQKGTKAAKARGRGNKRQKG